MRINTNMIAMNTQRQLTINTGNMSKSVEKLSSGFRINRAADDAAGLSISEKMRSQIRGLNMASKNAQDGISLIQSAEGALNEYHDILQRMRELTVQALNGVNQQEDVDAIQAEVDTLIAELDRISSDTEFNGKKLLNGSLSTAGGKGVLPTLVAVTGAPINLQVGANRNQKIAISIEGVSITDLATRALALTTKIMDDQAIPVAIVSADVTALKVDKGYSLDILDFAVKDISNIRSGLGALQNKLEHTVKNLDCVSENLSAAESRIRDVDMAKEMMTFTKTSIMQQAATAMLAQANQLPQTVLQLLR